MHYIIAQCIDLYSLLVGYYNQGVPWKYHTAIGKSDVVHQDVNSNEDTSKYK